MELIHQRAFESSVHKYASSNNDDAPELTLYKTKKMCTICNVLALFNLTKITNATTDVVNAHIEAEKERKKSLKKRSKKVRRKLQSRAEAFKKNMPSSTSSVSTKLQGVVDRLKMAMENPETALCDNVTIEKLAVEVRILTIQDQAVFRVSNGLSILMDLIFKVISPSPSGCTHIQNKTVTELFKATKSILAGGHDGIGYLLFSNNVGSFLDVLNQRLNFLIPDNLTELLESSPAISDGHSFPVDEIVGELMPFISFILKRLAEKDFTVVSLEEMFPSETSKDMSLRLANQIADIVSYIVSIGLIDRIAQLFNSIRGPLKFDTKFSFVHQSLDFLAAVVNLVHRYDSTLDRMKSEVTMPFLSTLKHTNMVGVVSLLYCLLRAPVKKAPPPLIPKHIAITVQEALKLLNAVAILNFDITKDCLKSEGVSLQLYYVANAILLCQCCGNPTILCELNKLLSFLQI